MRDGRNFNYDDFCMKFGFDTLTHLLKYSTLQISVLNFYQEIFIDVCLTKYVVYKAFNNA